ncbi:hypothetical protein [Demequina sp. NBRC 110055]|uniref:hypothetical protein n=1 Tax=Demequina sp. NBRC 110055 TaxID=1570344 RepID=UPI0011867E27|nr:hypothetical protein [Demequina sp. NBRC 110055]
MRDAAVVAGLLAGALAALTACTGDAPSVPALSTPAPTASALAPPTIASVGTIYRQRTLEAERKVEVRVTARSEPRGIVTSVSMTSPYFSSSGTVPTNVLLINGDESRLRVPLGAPVCPAGQGDTVATVEVRAKEGVTLAATRVTLEDAALQEINAEECAAKVATDAAQPSFATGDDAWVADGDTLATSVTLTRGSSQAPATLTRLQGNVIFALEPVEGALPLTLSADQEQATVPVTVRADRCDAHAFAESKKTYVFPAWFEVDGEEIAVEYRATGGAQERLYELFEACGEGNDSASIGGQ